MIEPMMATMLGFVTTDAAVEPALLQRALEARRRRHVQRDHRRRRVLDERLRVRAGQRRQRRRRSATTTIPLLRRRAAAGLRAAGDRHRPRRRRRDQADHGQVTGARIGCRRASATARAIANSPLVKTAIHGGDPNWGRLVAVAGPLRRRVRRSTARSFGSARGAVQRRRAARRARAGGGRVPEGHGHRGRVDLGTGGHGHARMWTCDLSAEYVRINAEYRT